MEWRCIDCGSSNLGTEICECGSRMDNSFYENETNQTCEVEDLNLIVSTSPFIHGKKIVKTLSIVSSEEAVAVSYFGQIAVGFTATWGGKSSVVGNKLGEIKDACLQGLKSKANKMGANAIVSVVVNYDDICTGSILLVTMTGTAVLIEES